MEGSITGDEERIIKASEGKEREWDGENPIHHILLFFRNSSHLIKRYSCTGTNENDGIDEGYHWECEEYEPKGYEWYCGITEPEILPKIRHLANHEEIEEHLIEDDGERWEWGSLFSREEWDHESNEEKESIENPWKWPKRIKNNGKEDSCDGTREKEKMIKSSRERVPERETEEKEDRDSEYKPIDTCDLDRMYIERYRTDEHKSTQKQEEAVLEESREDSENKKWSNTIEQ